MKTFTSIRPRVDMLVELLKAGWHLRIHQVGGDFEAFIRNDYTPGILLIDNTLGRIILDADGSGQQLLTEGTEADGDPEFDAILNALFVGELEVAL